MVECRVCGESKPPAQFYPQQIRKAGDIGECMECTKKRVVDNRVRRADYYKQYDAMRLQNDPRVRARHRRYQSTDAGRTSVRNAKEKWAAENPEKIRAAHQKWVAENPEKRSAHGAVNRAVISGRLVKPEHCERCGDAPGLIDGHHADYSKPLEVEWLCRSCHRAEHTNTNE